MTSLHSAGAILSILKSSNCRVHDCISPCGPLYAAPSVLLAAEKSSSTSCTAPTDEASVSTMKKTRFALDSPSLPSQPTQLDEADPMNPTPVDCDESDEGTAADNSQPIAPGDTDRKAFNWRKMQRGVDKMTERCSPCLTHPYFPQPHALPASFKKSSSL